MHDHARAAYRQAPTILRLPFITSWSPSSHLGTDFDQIFYPIPLSFRTVQFNKQYLLSSKKATLNKVVTMFDNSVGAIPL
jgi:hypothetical protein